MKPLKEKYRSQVKDWVCIEVYHDTDIFSRTHAFPNSGACCTVQMSCEIQDMWNCMANTHTIFHSTQIHLSPIDSYKWAYTILAIEDQAICVINHRKHNLKKKQGQKNPEGLHKAQEKQITLEESDQSCQRIHQT
jgi:hypothetical protein